jgi:hypothetical protein
VLSISFEMDKIEYRAVIKFFVKEGLIIPVFFLRSGRKVRTRDVHNNLLRYIRTPLIRTLGIRIANYPDRPGPSVNFSIFLKTNLR